MRTFNVAELLGVSDMQKYLLQVEEKLAQVVKIDNDLLQRPITRLVHAKSKRLRSMLIIGIAVSQNKAVDDRLIAGCAAIELIHISSLVHDDIIDNADTRWGIATVNSLEGTDRALLVGDYLLAKAGAVAATINATCALLISETFAALVDGEIREVADEQNLNRTMESLLLANHGKTAALLSASCRMAGLCAKLPEEVVDHLAEYGEAFGMAFQLIDDVLDLISTPELLGKPTGSDIKEGVYTLPVVLTLQGEHGDKLRRAIDQAHPSMDHVISILTQDGSITKTIAEVKKYNRQASDALKAVPGSDGLKKLPDIYLSYALTHLTDKPEIQIAPTNEKRDTLKA